MTTSLQIGNLNRNGFEECDRVYSIENCSPTIKVGGSGVNVNDIRTNRKLEKSTKSSRKSVGKK